VRSAKASLWAAQAAGDKTASSLRYQLTAAFAGIINARETVALSSETLKRRADNLELIRLKYEAGRENKAAMLETAALLKTAQWQHEKYRKDLRMAERGLNRLLGRPALAAVPELLLPQPPEPPADFSEVAPRLETHYSLGAARAAVASADAAADTARSGMLPSVKAGAAYLWTGTDWPSSPNNWNAGVSLSLPLFSSGKLTAGLDAAGKAAAAAQADYRDARDAVFLNAEDAFLAWREARSYLDVARSSLDAAEARAWLVRKQYLAGQSSYFEWRTVEEELITEKNQYLAAQLGLVTAHAAFAQASGE
jgi:outer membrane protein TolC